jgi:hypothetical protein
MRTTGFRVWDPPDGLVEIDLCPLHIEHFTASGPVRSATSKADWMYIFRSSRKAAKSRGSSSGWRNRSRFTSRNNRMPLPGLGPL